VGSPAGDGRDSRAQGSPFPRTAFRGTGPGPSRTTGTHKPQPEKARQTGGTGRGGGGKPGGRAGKKEKNRCYLTRPQRGGSPFHRSTGFPDRGGGRAARGASAKGGARRGLLPTTGRGPAAAWVWELGERDSWPILPNGGASFKPGLGPVTGHRGPGLAHPRLRIGTRLIAGGGEPPGAAGPRGAGIFGPGGRWTVQLTPPGGAQPRAALGWGDQGCEAPGFQGGD